MHVRVVAALAGAALVLVAEGAIAQTTTAPTTAPVVGPTAPSSASAAPIASPSMVKTIPLPGGTPALDARHLQARRTRSGYMLTGQALVNDACQAARFDRFIGNVYPPLFNLNQFRRPGTMGMLCIQHLMWVSAQARNVISAAPPRYVTVRTKKGATRVPILAVPRI